jgi:hypothetical protein
MAAGLQPKQVVGLKGKQGVSMRVIQLERNRGHRVLQSFVQGCRLLHPRDEDLRGTHSVGRGPRP